jgi:cytochrome c-type biogenesis protein CcmE
MTPKRKRLWLLLGSLGVLGVATGLVLSALDDNLVFFYSPTQVAEKHVAPDRHFRLGGLVEAGSVKKNGQEVRFTVTDTHKTLPVIYRGLLPDLFREGQGVVTEGVVEPSGAFKADSVLAKHDENYMPKEVADALKRSGHWKEEYGQKVGSAPQGRTQ